MCGYMYVYIHIPTHVCRMWPALTYTRRRPNPWRLDPAMNMNKARPGVEYILLPEHIMLHCQSPCFMKYCGPNMCECDFKYDDSDTDSEHSYVHTLISNIIKGFQEYW